jgi:membrane protease YdiL (CAAX protease family)
LEPTHSSQDNFAAQLRGFGPLGILAIIIILLTGNIFIGNMFVLPVGALLVLAWVKVSDTSWRKIGYAKPKSWLITIAGGIAFGIALKFLMKAIVMPSFGADPINQTYHFLAGNKALLPAAVWTMLAAGFGEETVFRGYLFERLGKLFGAGRARKLLIVLITSIFFGLAHYNNQGVTGVEQATITGLVFGTIFALTRSIWFVMIAHAAFDLTALGMIYYNLEVEVAHFFFK